MKMPWTGTSGLARPAVAFATLLFVSVVLCGGSLVTDFSITGVFGGLDPGVPRWLDRLLEVICYAAMISICVALAGLVVVGLAWVVKGIREP
jgi:hypothetical protein